MAPYYFSNGFSSFWYRENLRDYGFDIEEISSYGNYFSYLGQEMLRLYSMAKRYSRNLSEEEKKVVYSSIKLLDSLSVESKGAEELLCFGYMVRARKSR